MDYKKEFVRILKSASVDQFIQFASKLTAEERIHLADYVIEEKNNFWDRGLNPANWSNRNYILNAVGFLGCKRRKFDRNFNFWALSQDKMLLDKLLKIRCPDWFEKFIQTNGGWFFTYGDLMKLDKKGYINVSRELVVATLPAYVQENVRLNTGESRNVFKPHNLRHFPETFSKHIWWLFEDESNLNNADSFWENGKNKKGNWKFIFKKFIQSGDLDRRKVLREAALTPTRNFNKNLTGWFMDLFIYLEPTEEEIIDLQYDLANALGSPHSKPVNSVLKIYKKIAPQKAFDISNFIDYVPALLISETKSTVNSVLMILDKIASKNKEQKTEICELATQALFHNHDDIQSRTAKLIAKHGNPENAELLENIKLFGENLLSSARLILEDFFNTKLTTEEEEIIFENQKSENLIGEKIQPIETVDDLIFFASQAFDNNESYHFDLLPDALHRLKNKIYTPEVFEKLEPAFSKAFDKRFNSWGNNRTDRMLALFFLKIGRHIFDQMPDDIGFFVKKFQTHPLFGQMSNVPMIYSPLNRFLSFALQQIKGPIRLPFLSTPTHAPFWVDPLIFCEKIKQYQDAKIPINQIDFQLGIARLYLHDTEEAINFAKQNLQAGELKNLILFTLLKNEKPKSPITNKGNWLLAAFTKSPEKRPEEFKDFGFNYLDKAISGNLDWKIEKSNYSLYGYRKTELINIQKTEKVSFPILKKSGIIRKIVQRFQPKENNYLMYSLIRISVKYHSPEIVAGDVPRIVSMVPNCPELFFGQIVSTCIRHKYLEHSSLKNSVSKSVESLLNQIHPFGKMSHILLANGMTYSDKTTRLVAGEVWLKTVEEQLIQFDLLGKNLGKIVGSGFAPMKRLTDLISTNLFGNGKKFNRALEKMITLLLLEIPDKPVTGTKKLLEIYLELLHSNKSVLKREILDEKLITWESSASMKKVIQALRKI